MNLNRIGVDRAAVRSHRKAMIAVTGAAGLIGSAVVRELNRRGRRDLILVDHLGSSDKWMNLRTLQYLHYAEKDDFLERVLSGATVGGRKAKKLEAIIHLGACSATTERDASYLIENNYEYSRLLAEFAARQGIRMVYASSAATYGDGADGYSDDESQLDQLQPLNMYGYSKHMFDLWLRSRDFKPGFAGIKYFNVFGPNEYHKGDMQSLVIKAFRQIKKDGKIRLFKSYKPQYADGEQQRDFLYVEDAARLTVYLTLDSEARGLFNCGSGQANTWLQLTHAIFSALGIEPNVEFIEMPAELRDRYQYYTCAPMEKMASIGYREPFTPLSVAVADYVQNYLNRDEQHA